MNSDIDNKWVPTSYLRTIQFDKNEGSYLQQLWKSLVTGEEEWRGIPAVFTAKCSQKP